MTIPRLITLVALAILAIALLATVTVFASIPNYKLTPAPNTTSAPAFAAEVETKVKAANPGRGQELFNQYGCAACHNAPYGTGPYVVGLGKRAETRRPGYSAAAYLYESIIQPNAYVVPGFPAGVMLQNFKTLIPEADLYDLVAWLQKQ